MAKTLASNVHVADDNGDLKVFEAGSTPPAWAAKKITNPSAWADTDQAADAPEEDTPVLPDDAPPLGGKGSGVDVWRDYATTTFELEIDEDADRDAIVAAVASAYAEQGGGSES